MPRQPFPVLEKFDANKDGWLNAEERKPAREYVKKEKPQGRGFGRPGGGPGGPGGPNGGGPGFGPRGGGPGGAGPGGFRGGPPGMAREPGKPGPKVDVADAAVYPDSALFEPTILRTFFLEFENPDWEAELQDFHGTDVDVPATLTVDGKVFHNVGVHFRGASSYMMVPAGSKRSFSISLDMADKSQRLYGHRTLNLLNSNGDPTMLKYPLASYIGRQVLPPPRANMARVVVNGESWGLYPNVEHFDKDFVANFFPKGKKGDQDEARWKVPGSPRGGGGLTYLGDDVAAYKTRFELKTKDDPAAWTALVALCKTLNQTPPEQLEEALKPILDIDGALRFLALDLVLQNEDGYWIRDSDFSIYKDAKGKFHIIPHDLNETFEPAGNGPGGPGGPGGRGGPGGFFGGGGNANAEPRPTGVQLPPLYGLKDATKPLRSKLLAVPALRQRYLKYVRDIAEKALDWKALEPVVNQYVSLIEKEVALDTRKLSPTSAFRPGVYKTDEPSNNPREISLQAFAEQRRAYLHNHPDIAKLKAGD
jgi:hypothetical protein